MDAEPQGLLTAFQARVSMGQGTQGRRLEGAAPDLCAPLPHLPGPAVSPPTALQRWARGKGPLERGLPPLYPGCKLMDGEKGTNRLTPGHPGREEGAALTVGKGWRRLYEEVGALRCTGYETWLPAGLGGLCSD